MLRYSLDIYRTDDAILIHDGPGGWKRGWIGLAMSGFFGMMMLSIPIGALWHASGIAEWYKALILPLFFMVVGALPIFSFVYVFLYSLWRIYGHETILIDREKIRIDWWCFWGHKSKIYPRPEKLQVEASPGLYMFGGMAGMKLRLCKGFFGTDDMFLPSVAERKWFFDELLRFENEVPPSESFVHDPLRPKATLEDDESGKNLLVFLSLGGKPLKRIVPVFETVDESEEKTLPGVLAVRCTKYHEIVPRDHVLPDLALADCPHCGTVFELSELKTDKNISPETRLRIRRDADSLEITQNPLRNSFVYWMFAIFLLLDAFVVYLYFLFEQNMPGDNPFAVFRENHELNREIRVACFSLIASHIVCLSLPIWAFFDRRIIRIDREFLTVHGTWLFYSWRKTVSRSQLGQVKRNLLDFIFRNLVLRYDSKFLLIGTEKESDVEVLSARINHFLYTVPPLPDENKETDQSEPMCLGGVTSLDPVVRLHCPDCGAAIESEQLDFPQQTGTCPVCEKNIPVGNLVAWKVEYRESSKPNNIDVEQTDDTLEIRYTADHDKWLVRFNVAASWFVVVMFIGLMAGLLIAFAQTERSLFDWLFLGGFFLLPMGIALCFIFWMLKQEADAFYCEWTIRIDSERFEIEQRCKKWKNTVSIPRRQIVEALPNEKQESFWEVLRSRNKYLFLECLQPQGAHLLLADGSKQFLPLCSVGNAPSGEEIRKWLLATLNGFLASHRWTTENT